MLALLRGALRATAPVRAAKHAAALLRFPPPWFSPCTPFPCFAPERYAGSPLRSDRGAPFIAVHGRGTTHPGGTRTASFALGERRPSGEHRRVPRHPPLAPDPLKGVAHWSRVRRLGAARTASRSKDGDHEARGLLTTPAHRSAVHLKGKPPKPVFPSGRASTLRPLAAV